MAGSFDSGDVYNSNGRYYVRVYGNWSDDPGNNRSYVNVYAQYGGASGWWFCDHDVSGALYVNGGAVVGYGGRYCMNGAGSRNQLDGWSGWIYHDGNSGAGSFSTSVTFGMVNQSLSYSMKTASAGSGGTFTDYDRSAYTPRIDSLVRTSATSATITYPLTGSVNGPTTYVIQRDSNTTFNGSSGDYASWTNPATTFTDSGLSANKTYYYRIYAYGTEGGNKVSGNYGPYYGQPTAPQSINPSQVTDSEDRIKIDFVGPTYTGSGITNYTITRSGNPTASFTATSSPFYDTSSNKIPGESYGYSIVANTTAGSGYPAYTSASKASSGTTISSGPPYAPTSSPSISKVGRNVTVTSPAVSGNGGVSINQYDANQGYFVQYQTSTTSTGTYSAWSTPVKMSDQTNRQHTYQLLDAALWYKFRVYAANPVTRASDGVTQTYYPHNSSSYTANFSLVTSPIFVSAGGRRLRSPGEANENTFQPTETAKRYGVEGEAPLSQTVKWWDLTIAKRFDGTNWIDLT